MLDFFRDNCRDADRDGLETLRERTVIMLVMFMNAVKEVMRVV